jgi:pyruvate,water dikinase
MSQFFVERTMTIQTMPESTTHSQPNPAALVLPLDHESVTLALVGGKGANLTKLARAGFPVPGGFLITTAAYAAFVTANQLDTTIQHALAGIQLDDPAALTKASQTIQDTFCAHEVPVDLVNALALAYQQLGQPPVAVRSSATAEDLPDMSFAGQQDTYLNIVGEAALLDAVKRCWGSLWTARAIGYRSRNGIEHSDVALSVVVQMMVQSEVSGVLFTANPLTGNRNETVIDATLGLGEALVSGLVEPDQYIVETKHGQIRRKTLGEKATVIRSQQGGGTTTTEMSAATQQALPDAQIVALATLGARVADLYNFPQDIEWAWAADQLYLLQARPITSLYPVPDLKTIAAPTEGLDVFFSFGAVQGMLDPMTPLGRDAIATIFAGGTALFGFDYTTESQPLLYSAGERLWVRMTKLLHNRVGRRVLPKFLSVIEPSIGQAVEQLLVEPAFATAGLPQLATIGRIARFLRTVLPTAVRTIIAPDAQRIQMQQSIETMLAQWRTRMAKATTLAEKVALFEESVGSGFRFAVPTMVPRILPGLVAMNRLIALADKTFDGQGNGQRRALELTRGLAHNVTTEMDLALWQTAQTLRGDRAAQVAFAHATAADLAAAYLAGTLPLVAQNAVARFLDRYGMRGLAEIDFGRPRWRENPIQVMQMIQSYLQIDDPSQAPDAVFARGEAAAQAALDELAAALRQRPTGALQARLVYALAQRMHALAALRESPKFYIISLFGIMRQGLLASGAALVAQGRLTRADDLMFLHLKELKALAAGYAIDWPALVAERRALYDRERRRNQIPRLLLSDGRAFYDGLRATSAERDGVISGSPVSPGVVEGSVHVVFDPHAAQLAPGEILVCPGTDPAWTPLFLAAGGLVMEVGGLMTHGSVVAREYGIPAVVGVHQATTKLKTGQRIRVDGSSGVIELLDG